jgi:hypothetical protein
MGVLMQKGAKERAVTKFEEIGSQAIDLEAFCESYGCSSRERRRTNGSVGHRLTNATVSWSQWGKRCGG